MDVQTKKDQLFTDGMQLDGGEHNDRQAGTKDGALGGWVNWVMF